MNTREKTQNLVRAIDHAGTPHAPFRGLKDLLKSWQPPAFVGDKSTIGHGTCAVLERLIKARDAYEAAIKDAKMILDIK